eukprot:399407-Prorocentrum_lima.AAC.1
MPHDAPPSGVAFRANKAARRRLPSARIAVRRAWQWYGPLHTTRLDWETTAVLDALGVGLLCPMK